MKYARIFFPPRFCLMALTAALFWPVAAVADEYGDVNQLLRSGKFSEALTKADQYLAGKPRDPQMRFLKGVVQTEAARPTEAIATFTKLTEDYPELPEPYNNLAVLYAGQSQFDKARAALEMAIRTNPSYATAHENLGDVYAKLASQAYSKALQLDGSNVGVQPKLALIRDLFAPGAKTPVRTPAPAAAAPSSVPVLASGPTAVKAPAPVVVAAAPVASAPTQPSASAQAAAVATLPNPTVAVPPAAALKASGAARDVESAVQAWATAWSTKDINAYLGAYGKEFDPPGRQARKRWEDDRRARIVGKSRINVKLSDVSVAIAGNKATAKFKQAYSTESVNISSRKTLELVKAGERWVIVRESTGA